MISFQLGYLASRCWFPRNLTNRKRSQTVCAVTSSSQLDWMTHGFNGVWVSASEGLALRRSIHSLTSLKEKLLISSYSFSVHRSTLTQASDWPLDKMSLDLVGWSSYKMHHNCFWLVGVGHMTESPSLIGCQCDCHCTSWYTMVVQWNGCYCGMMLIHTRCSIVVTQRGAREKIFYRLVCFRWL